MFTEIVSRVFRVSTQNSIRQETISKKSLNVISGIVAQLITNIPLMKGTALKRLDILLRFWHFHKHSTRSFIVVTSATQPTELF